MNWIRAKLINCLVVVAGNKMFWLINKLIGKPVDE